MLLSLFKKLENRCEVLNSLYPKLKAYYGVEEVPAQRAEEISELVAKYGYLPYPYIKALEELTPAEILIGLEKKWTLEGVFYRTKFDFSDENQSPLSRHDITNSDWIKREQHHIKLINLAGLGNGNKSTETGKLINWLCQLLVLPSGLCEQGVMATTIYLIPFHPREFGCAYLPTEYGVSQNIVDRDLEETLGLNGEEQVKLFIQLAQLAGHPVIYDILPQTGRFSKLVLSNPQIARWFDINPLIASIENDIEMASVDLKKSYDEEDVDIIKNILKEDLHSATSEVSEEYAELHQKFLDKILVNKKIISNKMLMKKDQEAIVKRVRNIIAQHNGTKPNAKLTEADIVNQGEIIQALIKEGLWPAPGGAWCSSGVPVFDKMSEGGGYPMFRHFNYKQEDVTEFANLDCQTPFYFVHLENGSYNNDVINFYINFIDDLQEKYNFDGFRVDHIDHVADAVSQKEDGTPISYRAPQKVLGKLNSVMKAKVPHFAVLAEYMLWDRLYKEYHKNMNFDLLWGNDIIQQYDKSPEQIVDDNQELAEYNQEYKSGKLSILKTYNNQDGEFRDINQYPALLGEEGALFKWFKYKFLPGGKNAQRSVLYIDGDESFTQRGIEGVIGSEVAMERAKNYDFYNKFQAIRKFALENETTRDGEAQIMRQEDDGFVSWLITKDLTKDSLLVVANYLPKTTAGANPELGLELKDNEPVYDKKVDLPCDFKFVSEIKLPTEGIEMVEERMDGDLISLTIDKLEPSEFRVFRLRK